MCGS